MTLLDVNVLVALAWPNHVHHQAARAWFAEQHPSGWATCPVTESGFLRVSANVRVTPDARTVAEAASVLAVFRRLPGHAFWQDDVSLTSLAPTELERIVSHHQVTDAHLLMLASRRDGQLVTFDREAVSLGERLGCPALLLRL